MQREVERGVGVRVSAVRRRREERTGSEEKRSSLAKESRKAVSCDAK